MICVEQLSHLNQVAMEHDLWKSITISRDDPLITRLCFEDDLFIFAEVSLQQVDIIKHCLETFASNSRQKVS